MGTEKIGLSGLEGVRLKEILNRKPAWWSEKWKEASKLPQQIPCACAWGELVSQRTWTRPDFIRVHIQNQEMDVQEC
jgi:hypothetical protein